MARPKSFDEYPDCDQCGRNDEVIGFGQRPNPSGPKQVWYGNRCEHKFTIGDGRKKMEEEEGGEEEDDPGSKIQDRLNEEVDPDFIAATGLWLRYHCVPFKAIGDLVEEFFGIHFTSNGIRKLLYRYGGWMVNYARQFEYSYRMGRNGVRTRSS